MKKGLSLVLALIMVLTIFVSVPVVASAAEVTEITYTPAEPIVFWYGYETNLRNFPLYFVKEKVTPVGSVITYHYSDGTTTDYIYNGSDWFADDGGRLFNSVSIDTLYQYNWEIGTDNFVILNVGTWNTTIIQVPVTVIEHPVESIELINEKPIEFYENLGGQLVTNTSVPYYKYSADVFDFVINKHTSLVVNYTDGTKSVFVYDPKVSAGLIDAHGNKIDASDLKVDTRQEQIHWTLGSNNYCQVSYKGISVNVPVTILETPVASISYSENESIEVYRYENSDIYSPKYSYNYPQNCTSRNLIVNYKDGRSVQYHTKSIVTNHYGDRSDMFFDELGYMLPNEYDYLDFNWYLSANEPYLEVSYMGVSCNVPVTVVENPFSDMQVTLADYSVYEKPTGVTGAPYVFNLESHGNTVTFTYKTGGTVTYTYDGNKLGWFDQYGNEFKYTINYRQDSYDWVAGQSYPITVSFGDLTQTIYVTAVSNQITSVNVELSEALVLYENVDCSWSEYTNYICYNTTQLLPDGTPITFTYTDGLSRTYYYDRENDWLEDSNGVRINDYRYYAFYLSQENAFVLGTNYLFLTIQETSIKGAIPVELRPQYEAPLYYLSLVDGKWTCMIGDRKASCYEGLIEHNGEWYYVDNGRVYWNYTGLCNYQGCYYYVKDGCVDWYYTGLVNHNNEFYYVENGVLNSYKTGLVYCWDEWYYVENGWLNPYATTLVYCNDQWYYVENGEVNWNSNTLVSYNGEWYYTYGGGVAWDYTGLAQYNGEWYYVSNGCVDWYYTGLVQHNGVWYYVENGYLDWGKTTFAYYNDTWYYIENGEVNWYSDTLVQYNGEWYYTYGGSIAWDYTGLVQYNGEWYYVSNGCVDWYYTGLVQHNGVWYYVENGYLDWGKTTLAYYNDTWYYVENGEVNWNSNTLVQYNGDWYYTYGGGVAWEYTGLVQYNDEWYYVNNGCVDWSYSGYVNYNGYDYYVSNGYLDWSLN